MQKTHWLVIFFVFSLTACTHLSDQKKMEKLEATQSLYWKALRWNAPEMAARVIRYRNPARQFASFNPMKGIQVTAYQEVSSKHDSEKDTVTSYVLFDYIQQETGKVSQLRDREEWWFDEETEQWYLDGDFPDFKQAP